MVEYNVAILPIPLFRRLLVRLLILPVELFRVVIVAIPLVSLVFVISVITPTLILAVGEYKVAIEPTPLTFRMVLFRLLIVPIPVFRILTVPTPVVLKSLITLLIVPIPLVSLVLVRLVIVELVLVKVVIVPTPELICPLKVVAVTTPVTNTSPITCRADVGLVVPTPTTPET